VRVLAEDDFIYCYYLGSEIELQQWANTWNLDYVDPASGHTLTGLSAYRDAIAHHYFSTVALSYGSTAKLDHEIIAAMVAAGGYHRVEHIRYGDGWFDVYHYFSAR
jgi:hypothetical protein